MHFAAFGNVRIDDAERIEDEWLDGVSVVGLTAGASAPDHLVQAVIDRLEPTLGFELFSVTEEEEYFPLPPQLRNFMGVLQAMIEASLTAKPAKERGLIETDRTWTATDDCGNTSTCVQTITIDDTVDPTFDATPGDLTAQCDITEQPAYADYAAFTAAGGSASDPDAGPFYTSNGP